MKGKGPIDRIRTIGSRSTNGPNSRAPFDPNNYRRTESGLIVSKYLSEPIKVPNGPHIWSVPLVEAHSLEDLRLGTLPVEREMGEPFIGLEHNLFYPEYNLYVINSDNLTFYVIAEAAKRGDIELGASIFTLDAHMDIVPPGGRGLDPFTQATGQYPVYYPPAWETASLADYAEYAIRINPLQQLQALVKLGLLKEREIHLMMSVAGEKTKGAMPLTVPRSATRVGHLYHYPYFPAEHFNSLSRKKRVAHIDIDFHTDETDDQAIAQSLSSGNMQDLMQILMADVERVSRQKIDGFKIWAKETGLFRKAGLRIICLSPQIVHPEDLLWLTKEHVKIVMEEASAA